MEHRLPGKTASETPPKPKRATPVADQPLVRLAATAVQRETKKAMTHLPAFKKRITLTLILTHSQPLHHLLLQQRIKLLSSEAEIIATVGVTAASHQVPETLWM